MNKEKILKKLKRLAQEAKAKDKAKRSASNHLAQECRKANALGLNAHQIWVGIDKIYSWPIISKWIKAI